MELFERLERAIRQQSEEGELPDFLVEPLLAIALQPETFRGEEAKVRLLLTQVENFDAYAGAGCFGDSYGAEDLLRTLMSFAAPPATGD